MGKIAPFPQDKNTIILRKITLSEAKKHPDFQVTL
jgi:hypothetical protein